MLAFFSLCGLVLSVISLYVHTATVNNLSSGHSFCHINEKLSCDAVNQSAWSYLFGVPVASWGILFYFVLLVAALVSNYADDSARQRIRNSCLTLAVFALLFSVYLFIISELVIGALCPTCLGLYLVNILIFITAWRGVRPLGMGAAASAGMRELLAIPRAFSAKAPAQTRQAALLSLVLVMLAAMLSFAMPDILVMKFLLPAALEREKNGAAVEVLELWKKQAEISIAPVALSGFDVDYVKGSPDAPIHLVEYSDFECPFCRRFYFELEDLLKKYDSKVYVVFRNFPLDNSCNPSIPKDFHKNACEAALFTRCAGEQGQYWKAADFIFNLPALDGGKSKGEVSEAIAAGTERLGLDAEAMKECIASGRQLKKIHADIEEAGKGGIKGTPFLVVNNKPLDKPGIEPLRQIFDEVLSARR